MSTPVAPSQPKGIMSFFSKQANSSSSSSSSSNSNDPLSTTHAKKSLSWSTPNPDVDQLADRFENAKSSPAKKGAVKAKKVAVKPKAPKADKGNKDQAKTKNTVKVVGIPKVSNTPVMDLSNTDDFAGETPQVKNTPNPKSQLEKLFKATLSTTIKNNNNNDAKNDGDNTEINTNDAENDADAKMEESSEQVAVVAEESVASKEQVVVDLSTQKDDNQSTVPVKDNKKVTKKREKKEPKAKADSKKKVTNIENVVGDSGEIIDITDEADANATSETVEPEIAIETVDANSDAKNNDQPIVAKVSTANVKKSSTTKRSTREKKPTTKAVKSDEQLELEQLENLSPEILATINIRKEKIVVLADEILTLEENVEFNDVQIDVSSSVEDLIASALSHGLNNTNAQQPNEGTEIAVESNKDSAMDVAEVVENVKTTSEVLMELEPTDLISTERVETAVDATSSVVATSSSEPVPSIVVASEAPVDILKEKLQVVLARAVQGSSKPLQALIIDVSNILSTISERLEASIEQATETSVEGPALLKEMLTKFADNLVLGEEIKTLAAREAFGIRRKNAEIYDCVEKQAIWRWNVHALAKHFTKTGLKIIHDVSVIRKMYGKLVKAHHDVIKALERIPYDSSKVSAAEEKASKANGEYEKAKEKRREIEQKKLDKLAEKNREKGRKQEELDIKKREKEEAAAKKAAEKDADTKEKDREKKEKEQKLIQEKEKKEMEAKKTSANFQKFFKAPSSSKSSSAEVIDITNEKVQANTVKSSSFDISKFENSLKANMTMEDIQISNMERRKEYRKRPKKACRSKKILNVMVTNAPSGFGAESYSELKEFKVDNRMRLISFYEDHRPAYFGTISKKSKISGRRPFQGDHELLNYDFDSEAEWEEDDGEDIEDSDGDDEEGANELEYDDFFRHDDDFGSDVDDDGDVVAAVAIQKREGEEALGPTFLRTRTTSQIALRFEQGKCIEISQTEKDKNVVRLRMYSAVIFNQDIDITEALESSADKKAKEVKEKKDKKEAKKKSTLQNEPSVGQTASSIAPEVSSTTIGSTEKVVKPKKAKTVSTLSLFTDELTINLINEVHNKKLGIDKLIQEFLEKYPDVGVDKLSVKKKINEVAEKKKTDAGGVSNTWTIKSEFEIKYNLQLPELDVKVKRKRAQQSKPKDQQKIIKIVSSKEKSPGIDFDKHCEIMSSSDDPVTLEVANIMDDFLESAKKRKISPEKIENICVMNDDDENKENILDLDLGEEMVI